jgi:hypothetical protein
MKKVFKILFVLIVAIAISPACNEEVGFDAITNGFDSSLESNLVFLNGNMLYEVENNSVADVTIPLKLQVWGPLSASPVTVDVTVNSALSTAESPKHYSLASSSVTIPANKGGAILNLVMHTANFEKGDTVLLVMNMSSDEIASDLYASTANLQLSKKPECPFDIKTFTGGYIANETGYGEYNVSFTADAAVPNRIWQTNFWDWTNDLLAFDLDPVTGIVTVPSQSITMGGSEWEVVGSGTFDPCTGIMIVDFQGDVDGTHEVYTPGSVKSGKGGKGK